MRNIILKNNSTKAERVLAEQLKDSHIPFRHRVLIRGYECDFLVGGKLIIEVGGHKRKPGKDSILLSNGYSLYVFTNQEVFNQQAIKLIWHYLKTTQIQT